MNQPTAEMPWEDSCVVCDGETEGCEACKETGRLVVDGCPFERPGMKPAMEALRIANRWKQTKTPPESGGLNDQAESILQACDYIWSEQARRREAKGLIDLES